MKGFGNKYANYHAYTVVIMSICHSWSPTEMLSVLQWGTDSTCLWSAYLVPRHIKEVAMSKPPEYLPCLITIQLGNQAAKHPPWELGTCKSPSMWTRYMLKVRCTDTERIYLHVCTDAEDVSWKVWWTESSQNVTTESHMTLAMGCYTDAEETSYN